MPVNEYKSNKKWMTEEILNLMRKTRGAKESQNTERYEELDKQIERKCASAKEKWFNDRCKCNDFWFFAMKRETKARPEGLSLDRTHNNS